MCEFHSNAQTCRPRSNDLIDSHLVDSFRSATRSIWKSLLRCKRHISLFLGRYGMVGKQYHASLCESHSELIADLRANCAALIATFPYVTQDAPKYDTYDRSRES
jgi:hypothetical protein